MNEISKAWAGNRQEREVPLFDVTVFHAKTKPYAILIPVINEGPRIGRLLARMSKLNMGSLADVIVVDGGSTDGSLACCSDEGSIVTALVIKRGDGRLGAQLRCGYAHILAEGYDGVVTIDGNDKDDPEAIPLFIEKMREGYDFVQGSRFIKGGEGVNTPKLREAAIRLVHAPALSWASGQQWTDTTQGFRGYSSALLADPQLNLFRAIFDGYELLAYVSARAPQLGFKCLEVPSRRVYPDGPMPTKIKGLSGNAALLRVLWRACSGRYNYVSDGEAAKS